MLSILYFGRRVSPAASLCAPACPRPATQVLPWAGPFTSFLVSKQASRRRPRRGQPPDLLSRPLGGAREPELYSRAGSVGGDRTGFASFSGRTAFGTYFPEVRGHFWVSLFAPHSRFNVAIGVRHAIEVLQQLPILLCIAPVRELAMQLLVTVRHSVILSLDAVARVACVYGAIEVMSGLANDSASRLTPAHRLSSP